MTQSMANTFSVLFKLFYLTFISSNLESFEQLRIFIIRLKLDFKIYIINTQYKRMIWHWTNVFSLYIFYLHRT